MKNCDKIHPARLAGFIVVSWASVSDWERGECGEDREGGYGAERQKRDKRVRGGCWDEDAGQNCKNMLSSR